MRWDKNDKFEQENDPTAMRLDMVDGTPQRLEQSSSEPLDTQHQGQKTNDSVKKKRKTLPSNVNPKRVQSNIRHMDSTLENMQNLIPLTEIKGEGKNSTNKSPKMAISVIAEERENETTNLNRVSTSSSPTATSSGFSPERNVSNLSGRYVYNSNLVITNITLIQSS